MKSEKKTTAAHMKSTIKYAKNNLKRVPLDLQKEYYENILVPVCERSGVPVNTFIKQAIQEKIDRTIEQKDHENDQ